MKYSILLLVLVLSSCYVDVTDVEIEGTVIDSQTKLAIPNAKVSLICWRYGDTPDGSYTNKDSLELKTDNAGKFKAGFEKGAFLEIKTSATKYTNKHESVYLDSKKNLVKIELVRR